MSSLVMLLGRTSKPACGIDDYCSFLGSAFTQKGIDVERAQVNWAGEGWLRALTTLWNNARDWKVKWVLLQYTAGAWSKTGFPLAALLVVLIVRQRGARLAVTYHEPWRWEVTNPRWIDRVRGSCQDWVIRQLFRFSESAILPDPLDNVEWLPRSSKASFIPIGANVPESPAMQTLDEGTRSETKQITIFCLSKLPNLSSELEDIARAVQMASQQGSSLRMVFVGRGTEDAKTEIQAAFAHIPAQVVNLGLRSADEVSKVLSESDVMLCVRGRLFPRRGSALAGIACGVPMVAYEGPAQQSPIAEAGILFVPHRDKEALGKALTAILTSESLQSEMRERNYRCQKLYFSWDRIAARHIEVLALPATTKGQSTNVLIAHAVSEATPCAS